MRAGVCLTDTCQLTLPPHTFTSHVHLTRSPHAITSRVHPSDPHPTPLASHLISLTARLPDRLAAWPPNTNGEQEALSTATCSSDAEALVEDMAMGGEPLPSVLRLVCLLSVVCNGLKSRTLSHLMDELTDAYGHSRLALTWPGLQRVGLLKRNEARSPLSLQETNGCPRASSECLPSMTHGGAFPMDACRVPVKT